MRDMANRQRKTVGGGSTEQLLADHEASGGDLLRLGRVGVGTRDFCSGIRLQKWKSQRCSEERRSAGSSFWSWGAGVLSRKGGNAFLVAKLGVLHWGRFTSYWHCRVAGKIVAQ